MTITKMIKPILLFLIIGLYQNLYAKKTPTLSLAKVTPDGGVAITSVMCINEDKQGFIWFGTNNGLFRYNSHEIERYSYSQSDTNSLPTNRINQILKDRAGRLLIATERGISMYNPDMDNFSRLNIIDNSHRSIGNDVAFLTQTVDGEYWLLTERGIARLNDEFSYAEFINFDENTSRARLLYTDGKGNLWVAFQDGRIYFKTPKQDNFQYFAKGKTGFPRTFLADDDKIWVGYDNNGIICFDVNGNIVREYNYQSGFVSERIRSILKAADKKIWVATYDGIAIINGLNVETIIDSKYYPILPHHSIWSLYKDKNDIIWIGTWLGGLCYYSEYKNSVFHFTQADNGNTISHVVITSFALDPDDNYVWISTESGCLNRYDQENNNIKKIDVSFNNKKVKNIQTLAFDCKGRMWIGTRGDGVLYGDENGGEFNKLATPFIEGLQNLCILPVNDGIWISDYQQGVFLYSFITKNFTQYRNNPLVSNSLSDNHIHKMLQDHNGNLWFATENGLNFLKKGETSFSHFFNLKSDSTSLTSNFIYSMIEDAAGNIWLGTNGGGLNKFDAKTSQFKHFTIKDGLPGNDIYTIISDANSNLWFATENGICKFNPKTNQIFTFGNAEGIYNNKFYPNAAIFSPDGLMYFGGSNGFIYFKPEDILVRNTIKPSVIITNFYVNNKEIVPNNNKILTHNLTDTKTIRLKYEQNSFSFRFVANNYINPEKNRFKYRLVSFDENWTEPDLNGLAVFTNIPAGNFTFEVKASNNDGVWNDNPSTIDIKIIPPIWGRWYSFLFYILISVSIILFFRKQTINRQILKTQFVLEKVKRESEENIHQNKLQFYTNISHEFRTPLTLIMGPINRLIKSVGTENSTILNQLQLIRDNSERLLRLINQILDFRKNEAGKLILSPINADIVSFCRNIFNCFGEHAKLRYINYNFRCDLQTFNIDFDPEKLDKIIFNILSNAFKFSPDHAIIEMVIRNNTEPPTNFLNEHKYVIGSLNASDFVEILISDTGRGISEENLSKVFERFFQTDNEEPHGTGIGLALVKDFIIQHNGKLVVHSEIKKGTIFNIFLPHKQSGTITKTDTEASYLNALNSLGQDKTENQKSIDKSDVTHPDSLILIVEDNLELLNYLGGVFGEHFKISKARNGVEGMEQIHMLYPDLIISDIMMPEMDGIELCKQIKTDIRTSHIPVILLTALESVKDRIQGLTSGADAYISKPFDENLLVAQIINLLESRKILRESFIEHDEAWISKENTLDIDKKLIIKAIHFVEANFSNYDLSVEMLASELNLSRTTLHRKLKSLTDQSATEFIRYVRLKNAVKLLQSGKYKVNEVGYAVGFNSPQYFTNSFKNVYGISPSEFIKKNSV